MIKIVFECEKHGPLAYCSETNPLDMMQFATVGKKHWKCKVEMKIRLDYGKLADAVKEGERRNGV